MRGGSDRAARIYHFAALAMGIGVGAAVAEEVRLTEPPVAEVAAPLPVPGAEEALKLFTPQERRAVDPLESGDFPDVRGREPSPVPDQGADPLPIPEQRALPSPVPKRAVLGPAADHPIQVVVPRVEQQAFQRRILILNAQQVRIARINIGPRGRDAWITSILRTTDREHARGEAEQRLEEWLGVLTRAFALSEAQREKLRLAGRGDISRFLDECDALVGEAMKLEATMEPGDVDPTRPLWERCAELRKRYVSGLHEGDSLLRKRWQAVWAEQGSGAVSTSIGPPALPPQKSAYPLVRVPQD